MPCVEEVGHWPGAHRSAVHRAVLLLIVLLGAGCSPAPKPVPPASPASPPAAAASPALSPAASRVAGGGPAAPAAAAGALASAPGRPATDWDAYRLHAAERIVALNPGTTYTGPVPEPLLAIPVLEIELNRDGSVRRIAVLRQPGQALDTVQLAMAAVRRAAPFGPVGHLPRPWTFSETFLFNEQRRFKPRSLDS